MVMRKCENRQEETVEKRGKGQNEREKQRKRKEDTKHGNKQQKKKKLGTKKEKQTEVSFETLTKSLLDMNNSRKLQVL